MFERAAPPVPPVLDRIEGASEASAAPVSRSVEETEIALRVSLERAGVSFTRRLTLRYNGDSGGGDNDSVERLTIVGRAPSRDLARIAASARDVGGVRMEVRAEARRTAIPAGTFDTSGPPDNRASRSAALSGTSPSGVDASSSVSGGGVSTGFDAWLDRTFGSSRARAAFQPTARQLCDEFADAVGALDVLSRRFPTGAADARLSSRGRDDVRWLTAAYYARVTASYERLEAHLAPLTGSVSRRVLPATPPSHWRTTSAAIAPAIRELTAELAGFSSSTSSTSSPNATTTAENFELTTGASLREKLVAVVPR